MIRTRIALFLLFVPMAFGLRAEIRSAESPTFTVRLYNLAAAPAADLARAVGEVAEIFARSGVEVAWLDCGGQEPEPGCNQISGPSVANLRLMPPHMQPREGLPPGVFGFALMSTGSGFATTANVYFESVSEIADGRKYRRDVVLGAMMAHELGHLLLGVNSHSKNGLMTLPWGPKVLIAADRGMLGFSKREAARIREAAQARATATARMR